MYCISRVCHCGGEKSLGGGRAVGKWSLSVLSILRLLSRRRTGREELQGGGICWYGAEELLLRLKEHTKM